MAIAKTTAGCDANVDWYGDYGIEHRFFYLQLSGQSKSRKIESAQGGKISRVHFEKRKEEGENGQRREGGRVVSCPTEAHSIARSPNLQSESL